MTALKLIAAAGVMAVLFSLEIAVVVAQTSLLTPDDACPTKPGFIDGKCTAVAQEFGKVTHKMLADPAWQPKLEKLAETTQSQVTKLPQDCQDVLLHVLTEATKATTALASPLAQKKGCALAVCEGRDTGDGPTEAPVVLLKEILEEMTLEADKAGTWGSKFVALAKHLDKNSQDKKLLNFVNARVADKNALKAGAKAAMKKYLATYITQPMQQHLRGLFPVI